MSPDQPQQPAYYDANGQPVYGPPAPSMATAPPPVPVFPQQVPPVQPEQVQPDANSHVTVTPENHAGQSFDPRIRSQYGNEPSVVHTTREVEPDVRPISDELKAKHEESKRHYPHLNLSDGEVVVLDIQRHPIGLLLPLSAGGVVLLAVVAALIMYPVDAEASGLPAFPLFMMMATLVMILVGIGTYIAVWVYLKNQFFMTNESVIQEIQHSLFSKREQTVSLGSIEDASFRQSGIIQTMFNYGTVRLSTEGEETTYRFAFVADPRSQVAVLNNGVEAFKNGRPVDLNGNDN